jgi:hypothetical protein
VYVWQTPSSASRQINKLEWQKNKNWVDGVNKIKLGGRYKECTRWQCLEPDNLACLSDSDPFQASKGWSNDHQGVPHYCWVVSKWSMLYTIVNSCTQLLVYGTALDVPAPLMLLSSFHSLVTVNHFSPYWWWLSLTPKIPWNSKVVFVVWATCMKENFLIKIN